MNKIVLVEQVLKCEAYFAVQEWDNSWIINASAYHNIVADSYRASFRLCCKADMLTKRDSSVYTYYRKNADQNKKDCQKRLAIKDGTSREK